MPVSVSIKNIPDELAERLRERARRNHRSLQGELISILEEAARPQRLTAWELHQQIKAMEFSTPSESVEIIRRERDAR